MIVYDIQEQIVELHHKWFSSYNIPMFIFPFISSNEIETILVDNNISPRRVNPISKKDCFNKFWFSISEFSYLSMRYTLSEIYYWSYIDWSFVPVALYTCKETRYRKDICYDNSSYL